MERCHAAIRAARVRCGGPRGGIGWNRDACLGCARRAAWLERHHTGLPSRHAGWTSSRMERAHTGLTGDGSRSDRMERADARLARARIGG
ncbi:hypothetical protein Q0Z83_007030 [Actinoplanes sichuanensis]|nr:hypothetical protein Q0Z83_007030 [Actinoplanes sichuanensis]